MKTMWVTAILALITHGLYAGKLEDYVDTLELWQLDLLYKWDLKVNAERLFANKQHKAKIERLLTKLKYLRQSPLCKKPTYVKMAKNARERGERSVVMNRHKAHMLKIKKAKIEITSARREEPSSKAVKQSPKDFFRPDSARGCLVYISPSDIRRAEHFITERGVRLMSINQGNGGTVVNTSLSIKITEEESYKLQAGDSEWLGNMFSVVYMSRERGASVTTRYRNGQSLTHDTYSEVYYLKKEPRDILKLFKFFNYLGAYNIKEKIGKIKKGTYTTK